MSTSRLIHATLAVLTFTILASTAWFAPQDHWATDEGARHACYFAIALFAASLKVRGADVPGANSMAFLFVIIALVELDLRQTVLIGGCAVIVQSAFRRMTTERAVETLTALIGTLAAALVSQLMYRSDVLRTLGLEPPVRLVMAVMGAFVAYHLPGAIAGFMTDGYDRRRLFEALYLWSFPYHLIAGMVTGLYSFIYPFVHWYAAAFLMPMIYLVYVSYELYTRRLDRQRSHADRVSSLHLRTIETLALAIEAKDHTTHDHLKRVQVYAAEIAKDLGIGEDDRLALRAAAVLHDIGKLAVPEHIVSKPGKLTPEEFEKMKIHPVVGAEILERALFPYPVCPIVRAHHEKWDGTGYPDGLKGDEIPIGARILAAVDCLDALASDRQYRRALPVDGAMAEVAARAGRDFDPRVVQALQRRYRELESMAREIQADPLKPLTGGWETATSEAPRVSQVEPPPLPFIRSIGAAREEVQKLFDLSHELGSSLGMRETYAVLSRGLNSLVPYETMALFLVSGDELKAQFVHGKDAGPCHGRSMALGSGISGRVAATGKAAVNCDPSREGPGMEAFACMISVPLAGRHGVVGALSLYSSRRACYGGDHLRLLNAIAPKLSLAVENGLTFKRAEDSATTDYLTGLPNAHSLFVHLDREVELSRYLAAPLGILVCDLNGFKHINDTQGHLTGNRLLRAAAQALKSRCREYDYVGRMGGDEFVLVCSGLGHQALMERIPDLRAAIREAGNEICGRGLLDASFGCAVFPDDGTSADQLLACADRQMYQDKMRIKTGATYKSVAKPDADRRKSAAQSAVH